MNATEQLTLPFEHRPSLSGEDFLVAPCNAEAVAWIDKWPEWPSPLLILHGAPACGKTHLSQVFMEWTNGRLLDATTLRILDPVTLFEQSRACVVEDLDVLSDTIREETLFHLYNAAMQGNGTIMMTARIPAKEWSFTLPDLRSRLLAAPSVEIGVPDDDLVAAVLVKLFADRQLTVDVAVISYVVTHMERSFEAVRRLVDAVDAKALQDHRRITVPLVKEVMATQQGLRP